MPAEPAHVPVLRRNMGAVIRWFANLGGQRRAALRGVPRLLTMDIVRISDELRFALSEGPDGEVYDVPLDPRGLAGAIGRQLGLPGYYGRGDAATEVLLGLVDPLEKVLRGKTPKDFTDWSKRVLTAGTQRLNREDLCSAMKAFGWDDDQLTGEPRLRDLAKHIRRMLIGRLVVCTTEMLSQWKRQGTLDHVQPRRRRISHDRQVTIDRATTPKYTPPGRV